MKCSKCDGEMSYQNGGDSLDFVYDFDEWMECKKCGAVTDVPAEPIPKNVTKRVENGNKEVEK